MAMAYFQLSVSTEGLSEDWITFPGLAGRMERPPMSPEQISVLASRINEENGMGATCRFILRGKGRQLILDLVRGRFAASDPDDGRYQDVGIPPDTVEKFLQDYFSGSTRREPEPKVEPEPVAPARNWRIMEGSIAVVVLLAFVATVLVIKKYPEKVTSLVADPQVQEFSDPGEARRVVERWSGVYATAVHDGGMVIELKETGEWAYYEIWRFKGGNYVMDQLQAGECRAVMERQQAAILTDAKFLFYPSGENQLVFLQRPFKRIGDKLEDLSYLVFPSMETRLAGAP